jgi:hypothetical protein
MNLIFAFLECHAAYVGNFQSFGTTYGAHLQRNLTDRLSRNVGNYKSTMRNIQEDRRSRIIIVANEGDNKWGKRILKVKWVLTALKINGHIFYHEMSHIYIYI